MFNSIGFPDYGPDPSSVQAFLKKKIMILNLTGQREFYLFQPNGYLKD